MNKKIITLGLSVLTVTAILTGCSTEKKEAVNPPPLKELRVTYVKAPLNIPSIVDKSNETLVKEFAKDNIKVTFPEITSGAKQTEALAAGSLDVCSVLGSTSAILAASNGVDLKIIGIYSRAPKAFTIMVKNPTIQSSADLKGRKIAGPKGTILHQILIAALDKANLSPTTVDFVSLGIPASVNALLSGEVDAALVAGSEVLRAQNAGARILTTGEGLVDGTIVIATSNKFLTGYPEIVKKYLAIHKENISFVSKEPSKAFEMTAKETGLKVSDVEVMSKWYNFSPDLTDKDLSELNATQDFLLKTGLQKNKIDIKTIISDIK